MSHLSQITRCFRFPAVPMATMAALIAVVASIPTVRAADAPQQAEFVVYHMTDSTRSLIYTQFQFNGRSLRREAARVRGYLIVDPENDQFRIITYRRDRSRGQIEKTYDAPNINYDFTAIFRTGGTPNYLTLSLFGTGNEGRNCSHLVVGPNEFNDSTIVETLAGRVRPQRLVDRKVTPPARYEIEIPSVLRGNGVREFHNAVGFAEVRGYETNRIALRLKKSLTAKALSSPIAGDLKAVQSLVVDLDLIPRGYHDQNE